MQPIGPKFSISGDRMPFPLLILGGCLAPGIFISCFQRDMGGPECPSTGCFLSTLIQTNQYANVIYFGVNYFDPPLQE